jgi:hypothetical protein
MPDPLDDALLRARANLHDDLIYGRISDLEEAQKIADANGLGPLNKAPDKSLYEPDRLSRWTLSMVVAWIAWRDLERVRDADDEYRRKCFEWIWKRWRGPENGGTEFAAYEGWWLERRKYQTISLLSIVATDPDARPGHHSVYEAKDLLWSAAEDGRIVGEGIREGKVVDIPSREWRFLGESEYQDKEVLVLYQNKKDSVFRRTHDSATYHEVAFLRTRVLELWPASGIRTPELPAIDAPQTQQEALKKVIGNLWPKGLPARSMLRAKERNKQIRQAMEGEGYKFPLNDMTLARAIQRALRPCRRDRRARRRQ